MKNYQVKFINLILTITLSFTIIMGSIILATLSKFIYYFDINYLDIPKFSGLTIAEIKENYNYTISYIFNNSLVNFQPPTLSSSLDGSQHFLEVRNLFNLGIKLFIIGIIISILLLIILKRNRIREYKFVKYTSFIILSLPVLALIFINTDFTFIFTIFHKILFNNDKWLLDPVTDPIINIMPEEYFAHCAIAILLYSSILVLFLNHIINKYKKSISR
jgi:integral membrane protein (TIGR01906 family)